MSYLITIPAYNEEEIIENTIHQVRDYLEKEFSHLLSEGAIVLCVAINGSNDGTQKIIEGCQKEIPYLKFTLTPQKGRGIALDNTWIQAIEDVLIYIDGDLAYSLEDLGNMIRAHESNSYDLVVASRRVAGSIVKRHWVRTVLTEGYNRIIKLLFLNYFSDAQAGCKSIRRNVYLDLRSKVNIYRGWFFDTALLIYAEKCGYRINDLKITCIDNRRWRLAIIGTVVYFLHRLIILRLRTLIHGYK